MSSGEITARLQTHADVKRSWKLRVALMRSNIKSEPAYDGLMPGGMMLGMGLVWLLVMIFLVLGIAAAIKYLRS
jgi:uncharacterized membrane protein